MKTMIMTVPIGDPLDFGPYDILDMYKGSIYKNEADFRHQDWVQWWENVRVYELPDFIEACNEDSFDPTDFWLGYFYFSRYNIKFSQNTEIPEKL